MEKLYNRINFENAPSKKTPLSAENLNKIDSAINAIDNRVIETHDELKSDLSKQNDDSKNMFSDKFNFDTDYLQCGEIRSWENGAFSDERLKSRASTPSIHSFPYKVDVVAEEGFMFCFNFFEKGVYTNETGWVTKYTVEAGQQFKLMISRETEDTTEVADIAEFATMVTFTNLYVTELRMAKEELSSYFSGKFNFNAERLQQGEIRGWENGIFTDARLKSRASTPNIHFLPVKVEVVAKEGFIFCFNFFENGVYKSETGWKTKYTLEAGTEFKFMISREEEVQTEVADIVEFASMVDFVNVGMNELNNVAFYNTVNYNFVFGGLSVDGVVPANNRIVTKDILSFPHDIILKCSPNNRMGLWTYDENGVFVKDFGWVTQNNDYVVPANTYFRLLVGAKDYSLEVPIMEKTVYDCMLYKNIDIRHGYYPHIRIFDNAIEQAKRETASAISTMIPSCVRPQKLRSINHRGYSSEAPENTLPAYKKSAEVGFEFVECDVQWTSDNIPVLLHDLTINRTGRNADGSAISEEIAIRDLTYEEALQYDFGIFKGSAYSGTKIPTFREFLELCRNLALHPYIEIKDVETEQIAILFDIVKENGLENACTWISFDVESLRTISELHPSARLGYVRIGVEGDGISRADVQNLLSLRNQYNDVFLNASTPYGADDLVSVAKTNKFPLEVWCPNTEEEIIALPSYVSGVTSDNFVASEVMRNHALNN